MSKLNLLQLRKIFLSLAVLAMVFFVGYRLGRTAPGSAPGLDLSVNGGSQGLVINRQGGEKLDFSLFWEVWDKLQQMYIDKAHLDERKMLFGAIKGMVASADDPYTVFLSPDENKRAKDDLGGSFEGVGIQLGYKEYLGAQRLAVITPLEGSPAIQAGVKAGDLILKIDGQDTSDLALPEGVEKIRGPHGSVVKLTLFTEGDQEPHEVAITRGSISVPSVELKWIGEDKGEVIAHLKVTRFGEQTTTEWNKKIREILSYRQAPVKGIVLDLRGNPGGFFQGAIELGSDLVASGVIVQQESATGDKEQFRANGSARLVKLPLVVLINEGSASASEILAGALRDLRGVKLIGEKTFGKGSVQEALDLRYNSGLHITTYRWLLPSGANIDKNGIKPDIEVKDEPETNDVDEQLVKAIEQLQ